MEYNTITAEEKWFSSLTTRQKEHIGRKILEARAGKEDRNAEDVCADEYRYPLCTGIYLSLTEAEQARIMSHCRTGHGFEELTEQEGFMFSE